MGSVVVDFFKGIIGGIGSFLSGVIDVASALGSIIIDGITNVVDFLQNAFTTLNELVEIFPFECRMLLLSFLGVAAVYLAYKIVKGG